MNNRPLLLGHRGARVRRLRENTMQAFDFAVEAGCHGFEFDVRVTADGQAVICHDPKSDGLAIAQSQRGELSDLCSFEAVLAAFGKRAFLDIELKVPGLEQQVSAALRKQRPKHGFVISSFLVEILAEFRALDQTAPLGIIFEKLTTQWRDLAVEYVMPHRSLISPMLIEKAHANHQKVIAWTVNDSASMLRFAGWGVDGIISDNPQLLVRTLRSPATKTE